MSRYVFHPNKNISELETLSNYGFDSKKNLEDLSSYSSSSETCVVDDHKCLDDPSFLLNEGDVFGVMWNYGESSSALTRLTPSNDPYSLVTRIISTEPVPATTSVSGSSPFDSYEPWASMECVNLNAYGTVLATEDDSDFTRTDAIVMTWIPFFYIRVIDDSANSKRYYYLSSSSFEGASIHPGSGQYVGTYPSSTVNGYISSRSGQTRQASQTIETMRSEAQSKGSGGWGIIDIAERSALQFLYLIEFADWNSQSKIGEGPTSDLSTGDTDSISYHTGVGPNGAIKYRTVEGLWRSQMEWTDGFNTVNGVHYISTDRDNYASDTTSGYTQIASGSFGPGMIAKTVYDENFQWLIGMPEPGSSTGTRSTYLADYGNLSGSDSRVLQCGSYYSDDYYAGMFYFSANQASSFSNAHRGSRLSYVTDTSSTFPENPVIYGFHIDSSVSDSADAVTYLSDCANANYTPAYMDFDSGTFNWGSWSEDEFFIPRPCMVKYDGTVDYYLNPNDYTLKEDGTTSDVANTSYEGNAMMEWGRDGCKIWYQMVPDEDDATSVTVRFANYQVDGTYHCWSFYNGSNKIVDHFYTSIYMGYASSSRLRSISGVTPSGQGSNTSSTHRTYAQNMGSGWDFPYYADWVLIGLLLTLMSKTRNSQAAFGHGSSTYGSTTGSMNSRGLFYGTEDTGGVKVFGMEYWWGNGYTQILGLSRYQETFYIKLTQGSADGTSATDFSLSQSTVPGYYSVSGLPISGTSSHVGFITNFTYDSMGRMWPSETNSYSNGYDYWYADSVQWYTYSGRNHVCPAFIGNYDLQNQEGCWYLWMNRGDSTGNESINRISFRPQS